MDYGLGVIGLRDQGLQFWLCGFRVYGSGFRM